MRVLAGAPSARLEAELLLGEAAGLARTSLLAHPERAVDAAARARFRALLARRAAAEPMAYILGEREFYGRVFKVDRRALVPRPETEALVEVGIEAVRRWRQGGTEPRVVELGTGSGAVAISLAAETSVAVVATDLSWQALSLARENALRLGHSQRLKLVQGDLLAALRGPIHVLLANLPYVPSGRDLPADVGEYEPHLALFGGPRGTELLERALRDAARVLAPGADLAFELDEEEQAAPLATLAAQLYPTATVEIRQDAGGYDRVLYLAC